MGQNPNFDRKFVSGAPLRCFLSFEFAMSTHKVVSDNSVPIIHLNRESFTEQDLHQKAYLGKTVNLQIKSWCSPQEKLHFRIPDRVKGSTFCSRFVETFPILIQWTVLTVDKGCEKKTPVLLSHRDHLFHSCGATIIIILAILISTPIIMFSSSFFHPPSWCRAL